MCAQIIEDSLSNTQAFPTKLKHLNAVCPRLATNMALPLEVTVFWYYMLIIHLSVFMSLPPKRVAPTQRIY